MHALTVYFVYFTEPSTRATLRLAQSVLQQCTTRGRRPLVALMCFGGLRRSEIVALDVGDVAPGPGASAGPGQGGCGNGRAAP